MAAPEIVDRWNRLTRETLPAMAGARGWPIALDHCFQRVLLDNAVGGPWRDVIAAPAWRNADDDVLERAIAMGEAAADGSVDIADLNRRSLDWRGKRGPTSAARRARDLRASE